MFTKTVLTDDINSINEWYQFKKKKKLDCRYLKIIIKIN